jgi:putative endonuclease
MPQGSEPYARGSKHHLEQGRQGEELAVNHLKRLGYRIICRNYRCSLGEIDIIARHRGVLVFVEVKSRRSEAFGSPKLAITPAKQHVVTVSDIEGSPHFEVIENAFESTY